MDEMTKDAADALKRLIMYERGLGEARVIVRRVNPDDKAAPWVWQVCIEPGGASRECFKSEADYRRAYPADHR